MCLHTPETCLAFHSLGAQGSNFSHNSTAISTLCEPIPFLLVWLNKTSGKITADVFGPIIVTILSINGDNFERAITDFRLICFKQVFLIIDL